MYKFLIASILLVALATVYGYNFEDSYYNGALSNELEDIKDSMLHARNRRSAEDDKCEKKRFSECCKTNFFSIQHHQFQENKKECFLEIFAKNNEIQERDNNRDNFQCNGLQKLRQDATCFVQCLSQKNNLVDKKGNLKEGQFSAWVQDNFQETWVVSRLESILPKCLGEAHNATAASYAVFGKANRKTCNPATIKAVHCLFREIQLSCPESEIKDRETCNRFRASAQRRSSFRRPQVYQN